MKNLHGVPPLLVSRQCLETHLVLILILLSCNPSPIEKSNSSLNPYSSKNQAENLSYALTLFRDRYVDKFSYLPDFDTSIEAICNRLDPYSCYLLANENEQFDANLNN